jgi:MSHA pilin protein MshD
MCTDRRKATGFTLAELLLLIVVFSVALAGILLVINTTTTHSADPMVRKQAMAIAESMMEEVSLMPYAQGGWSGAATPANRANFDDAQDYNGFQTNGIYRIEDGTPIAGLENYTVNVAVVTAAVGGVAGALGITVTVTGPIDTNYALTGYKYGY